jgi:prephenate dehydratase
MITKTVLALCSRATSPRAENLRAVHAHREGRARLVRCAVNAGAPAAEAIVARDTGTAVDLVATSVEGTVKALGGAAVRGTADVRRGPARPLGVFAERAMLVLAHRGMPLPGEPQPGV